MENGFRDYLSGNKNVVKDEFIISREKCANTNSELVFVQHSQMADPLYTFWHSLKGFKSKPKHTGGKKPYAMEFVRHIRDNGLIIGSVNIYIQTWNAETGKYHAKDNPLDYIICSPTDKAKEEYAEDTANTRRGKMKRVV